MVNMHEPCLETCAEYFINDFDKWKRSNRHCMRSVTRVATVEWKARASPQTTLEEKQIFIRKRSGALAHDVWRKDKAAYRKTEQYRRNKERAFMALMSPTGNTPAGNTRSVERALKSQFSYWWTGDSSDDESSENEARRCISAGLTKSCFNGM
jgi:hypothetical protein